MKKIINSAIYKEWVSLILGVMAAAAVLCTQSFNYSTYIQPEEGTQTEVPSDQHEDADKTTISQDAVSSFVQLTLTSGLHFIADIYQGIVEEFEVVVDQKIDFNSYFKALFRLIISPNAP